MYNVSTTTTIATTKDVINVLSPAVISHNLHNIIVKNNKLEFYIGTMHLLVLQLFVVFLVYFLVFI